MLECWKINDNYFRKDIYELLEQTIKYNEPIDNFLRQGINESSDFNTTINSLMSIFSS